ncbi:MAG TPA: MarR family transcriptional regulator [Ramlibacter sp.]|nr:MarR family transcriptional regulator [Ramlibacter sp.]
MAPLDRTLTYRLHLVNKLTDKANADSCVQELRLPVGQARCLAAIGNFAPLSVVELAARSNFDKAQASRASQALVDRGLVAKRASGADARGVVLSLTPRGRRLWARVIDLMGQRNSQIFGCLSVAERKELGGMLDRLIAHAKLANGQIPRRGLD